MNTNPTTNQKITDSVTTTASNAETGTVANAASNLGTELHHQLPRNIPARTAVEPQSKSEARFNSSTHNKSEARFNSSTHNNSTSNLRPPYRSSVQDGEFSSIPEILDEDSVDDASTRSALEARTSTDTALPPPPVRRGSLD